jgi:hypothetical protein
MRMVVVFGLARAVGPQEAEDLTFLHREGDAIHGVQIVEGAGQVLSLNSIHPSSSHR